MVGLFLAWQTLGTTDTTAQKVNSHKLSTVALTEMALPELLRRINFDCRHLGWQ
jgi:hypothetical protein